MASNQILRAIQRSPDPQKPGQYKTWQLEVSLTGGAKLSGSDGSVTTLTDKTAKNSGLIDNAFNGVANKGDSALVLVAPVQHFALRDDSMDESLELAAWSWAPDNQNWRKSYAQLVQDFLKNAIDAPQKQCAAWDLLPLSCIIFKLNQDKVEFVYFNARQRLYLGSPDGDAPLPWSLPEIPPQGDLKNIFNSSPELENLFLSFVSQDLFYRPDVHPAIYDMALQQAAWQPQISGWKKGSDGAFRIWSGGHVSTSESPLPGWGVGLNSGPELIDLVRATELSDKPVETPADLNGLLKDWKDEKPARPRTTLYDLARIGTHDTEIVGLEGAHPVRSPAHDLFALPSVSVEVKRADVKTLAPFRVFPFFHRLGKSIGLGFARGVPRTSADGTDFVLLSQWLEDSAWPDLSGKAQRISGDPANGVVQGLAASGITANSGIGWWNGHTRNYLGALDNAGQEQSFAPLLSVDDATAAWNAVCRLGEVPDADGFFGRSAVVRRPPRSETVLARATMPRSLAAQPANTSTNFAVQVSLPHLHAVPGRPATGKFPAQATLTIAGAKRFDLGFGAPTVSQTVSAKMAPPLPGPFDPGSTAWFGLGALDIHRRGTDALMELNCTYDYAAENSHRSFPDETRLSLVASVSGTFKVSAIPAGEDDMQLVSPEEQADLSQRAKRFTRESPLVVADEPQNSLLLNVDEKAKTAEAGAPVRSLTLNLSAEDNLTAPSPQRALVVDTAPFSIFAVDLGALSKAADGQSAGVASWSSTDSAGARWRLTRQDDIATYWLPTQSVGEAMEKGAARDIAEGELVGFRFSPPASLQVRIEERNRTPQPPWNIRALLSDPTVDLPGVRMVDAVFDLAYGLQTHLSGADLRLVETAGWRGEPVRPAIDRVEGITQNETQSDVAKALGAKYESWSLSYSAWNQRLGIFELRDEQRADGFLDRDTDVDFLLHQKVTNNPLPSGDAALRPNSRDLVVTDVDTKADHFGLAGGVLWGFESALVLESVARKTSSVGGAIRRLAFSALGGTGDQDALFDEGREKISTSTDIGRMHGYTLTRKGRIGVLWNRAIHVIRFERVPLVSPQFEAAQDRQQGRMILRKVEEYVEILEPVRETGTLPISGCEFVSRRMRVDSAWGQDLTLKPEGLGLDVDYGWHVPLWDINAGSLLPYVYPMPEIWIKARTGDEAARPEERFRHLEPEKLYFYTDTRPGTGSDTDLWEPIYTVDYIDVPDDAPDPSTIQTGDMRDPTDDRATLPAPPSVPLGMERFTWAIGPGERTNLTAGRSNQAITAALSSLTMMRATKANGRAKPGTTRATAHASLELPKDFAKLSDGVAALGREARQGLDGLLSLAAGAAGSLQAGLADFEAELRAFVPKLNDQQFPGLTVALGKLRDAVDTSLTEGAGLLHEAHDKIEALKALLGQQALTAADLKGNFDLIFKKGSDTLAKLRVAATQLETFRAELERAALPDLAAKAKAVLADLEAVPVALQQDLLAIANARVAAIQGQLETRLAELKAKTDDLKAKAAALAAERAIPVAKQAAAIWSAASGNLSPDTLCQMAANELNREAGHVTKWFQNQTATLIAAIEDERRDAIAKIDAGAGTLDDAKKTALAALDGAASTIGATLNVPSMTAQRVKKTLEQFRADLVAANADLKHQIDLATKQVRVQADAAILALDADVAKDAKALSDAIRTAITNGVTTVNVALANAVKADAGRLEDAAANLAKMRDVVRDIRGKQADALQRTTEKMTASVPVSWKVFATAIRKSVTSALDALRRDAAKAESLLNDAVVRLTDLSAALRLAAQCTEKALQAEALRASDAAIANIQIAHAALDKFKVDSKTAWLDLTSDIDTSVKAALDALVKSIDDAIANVDSKVTHDLDQIAKPVDQARGLILAKIKAVADGINQITSRDADAITKVKQALNKAGSDVTGVVNGTVAAAVKAFTDQVDGISKKVCDAFANGAAQLLAAALDDVKTLIGDPEKYFKDLANGLDIAGKTISNTLDSLETNAQAAVRSLETQLGQLASWAGELVREIPATPAFRAPFTFPNLLRAFGRPPELPDLGFNRDGLAYFFDLPDRVRITPSFALLDRFGAHMRGMSISLPTIDLGFRLEPPKSWEFPNLDIGRMDIGKILPDMGWLKLDALFKGKAIGSGGETGVTVTHGVDKQARIAWARANLDLNLGTADLLPPQIMRLTIENAHLTGFLRLQANLKGETERQVEAHLTGNWHLGVAGVDICTLKEARFDYDQAGGPRFKIDPSKIDYSAGLAFLSELAKQFAPEGDFSDIDRKLQGGLPLAFSSKLDIPIPDVAAGAFALTNLHFSAGIEGELLPEFRISARAALGGPTKPFAMTVCFLGGGGYLTARTSYAPFSGTRSTEVVIALGVAAQAAFRLGPMGGGVMFWFGIQARFVDNGGGGGGFSAAAIMVISGGVTVWGFVTVGIAIVLSIEYSNGGATGYGSVSISIQISRFFSKSFSSSFTKVLSGSGNSSGSQAKAAPAGAALAMPPGADEMAAVDATAKMRTGATRTIYGNPLFHTGKADGSELAQNAAAQTTQIFSLLDYGAAQ